MKEQFDEFIEELSVATDRLFILVVLESSLVVMTIPGIVAFGPGTEPFIVSVMSLAGLSALLVGTGYLLWRCLNV